MKRRALLGVLLGLPLLAGGPGDPASASPERASRYAPVPPGLLALRATQDEEALAARGILALEDPDPATSDLAARALLLAGHAGLQQAALRLAEGPIADAALLRLIQVIAASDRPEADDLLVVAAGEPRHEARSLAAHALGAGRTAGSVATLAALAGDPVPGVRAAALRALFAAPTPTAVAARAHLPPDPDPVLRAFRLRLHRLRGDAGREVLGHALSSWLRGTTSAERLAAMRLLAAPASKAPAPLLAALLLDLTSEGGLPGWWRERLGLPAATLEPAEARLAEAECLAALLRREGLPAGVRAQTIELGVSWIASPVRSRGLPADDEARALLFATLPDVGPDLAGPVVARLKANAFADPAHGVRLLLGLPTELALAALRSLVSPEADEAPGVLAAVSGGLRDLRRLGDETTARCLLAAERPVGVRLDAVAALEGEEDALALPLLSQALREGPDPVASQAAAVLERRGGTAARALLEAAVLEPPWRPFEQDVLERLAAPTDEESFRFLDRALTAGPRELRLAVFQTMADPRSPVRGPRALALVRRAMDEPALRMDTGTIGKALAPVDGPAAVAFIRERWRGWRSPGVLVRNLQVTPHADAREFALEVASTLPDDDEGMLKELATVLAGACPKDAARTDPFWRRLLASGREELVRIALRSLLRVPHGAMADLLLPLLSDRAQDPRLRRDAVLLATEERDRPSDTLLWGIASDRNEDDELREATIAALRLRPSAAIRDRALAWIAERLDEPTETVVRIAELAGTGADAAQAADLLQLLEDELAARYATTPYFRRHLGEEERARSSRAGALAHALSIAGDEASLEAMTAWLFDPRFAAYSTEARRFEALRHGRGGGPLTALEDPPELEILLHQAEEDPNDTPSSPVPPEASEIVSALGRRGLEEAAVRLGRAVEAARANGRLAAFSDVYLLWLANRLRVPEPEGGARRVVTRASDEAATVLEDALLRTHPSAGAEELLTAERRAQRLDLAEDFAGAAEVAADAARLAARTGLADIPPARWLDRGLSPGASWIALRAQQDLLEGAAAAKAGKTEEALDAFRRGTARAPLDPRVLRTSARLKAITGFDLLTAEAEALRALELERRQGEAPSGPSERALARVRERREAGR